MKQYIKNLACAGTFLALGASASGDTIYNTSATYNGSAFQVLSGQEIGNEITLSSSTWSLTSFAIEYYSPSANLAANVGLQVSFYKNDGAAVNGYASPGTLLFETDWYYNTLAGNLPVGAHTVTFNSGVDFSTLILPTDFTFTVTFTNVDSVNNIIQLPLADDPTTQAGVSATYGDYWNNNAGSWQLLTNSAAKNNLLVNITATNVPEPSLIYLGAVGVAALLGARKLKRKA